MRLKYFAAGIFKDVLFTRGCYEAFVQWDAMKLLTLKFSFSHFLPQIFQGECENADS